MNSFKMSVLLIMILSLAGCGGEDVLETPIPAAETVTVEASVTPNPEPTMTSTAKVVPRPIEGRGSSLRPSPTDPSLIVVMTQPERTENSILYLYDLERAEIIWERSVGFVGYSLGVVWSPDGEQVAVGGLHIGTITIFEAATGDRIYLGDLAEDTILYLDYSPDGSRLVFGSGNPKGGSSTLSILDIKDETVSDHEMDVSFLNLSWSPDGRYLAAPSTTKVMLLDTESGEQQVFAEYVHEGENLFTRHTTKWLSADQLFVEKLGRVTLWTINDGIPELIMEAERDISVWFFNIYQDGLLYVDKPSLPASGVVAYWDYTSDEVSYPLGIERIASAFLLSPDQRLIALYHMEEGKITIWNLESKEMIQSIPIEGEQIWVIPVYWSADSRWLFADAILVEEQSFIAFDEERDWESFVIYSWED